MIVVKVFCQYHAREKDSTNDTEGRRTQHNFSHIYDHPQIVIPSVSSFDSYQIFPLVATVTPQTGSICRLCSTCSIAIFLQLALLLVVCVGLHQPSYPLVPSIPLFQDYSVTSCDSPVTVGIDSKSYSMFGYRNPELYRHYVRFDCAEAHLKALGD